MENKSHALMAGIFALLMGTAMVAAVWWFSEGREATKEYILVSKGNIGSLNREAGVRYRGMAAGKVTDIRLDPDDPHLILVRIAIREDLPITMGTRAVLDSRGVTGIAFIQLEDEGHDPRPLVSTNSEPPRMVLHPSVISQITDSVINAMNGLDRIAKQMNKFFGAEGQGRLNEFLAKLHNIIDGAEHSLAELPVTLQAVQKLLNQENLNHVTALLDNLEQLSGEAIPAVGELRELFGTLEAKGEVLEASLNEMKSGLKSSADSFRDETIPRFHSTLNEISNASKRISSLMDELESSPQILIRGKGMLPGPGETGFDQ